MKTEAMVVTVILTALAAAAPGETGPRPATVAIRNGSSVEVHAVHLSEAGVGRFGKSLLGGTVLKAGELLRLPTATCSEQDVKLIDAAGRSCVFEQIGLCSRPTGWGFTDRDLQGCEGFGQP